MQNIQSKSLVARAEGQLVKTFGFGRPSVDHLYSVIHISIPPSKELCSKMAPGEVGVSLP